MVWPLVGYIAKRRVTRAGWVSPWRDYPDIGFPCDAPVEAICYVSRCVARVLGGACDDPEHSNVLGLYDHAEFAWGVVPIKDRPNYALFAYRLGLVQFEDGQEEPIEMWWEKSPGRIPKSFVRLGWDAVQGGNGHNFGCSPLSCNSGSDDVRCPELNRYGLVSNKRSALALAHSFSITKPEPGPYCVVEVWRDGSTAAFKESADVKPQSDEPIDR